MCAPPHSLIITAVPRCRHCWLGLWHWSLRVHLSLLGPGYFTSFSFARRLEQWPLCLGVVSTIRPHKRALEDAMGPLMATFSYSRWGNQDSDQTESRECSWLLVWCSFHDLALIFTSKQDLILGYMAGGIWTWAPHSSLKCRMLPLFPQKAKPWLEKYSLLYWTFSSDISEY